MKFEIAAKRQVREGGTKWDQSEVEAWEGGGLGVVELYDRLMPIGSTNMTCFFGLGLPVDVSDFPLLL